MQALLVTLQKPADAEQVVQLNSNTVCGMLQTVHVTSQDVSSAISSQNRPSVPTLQSIFKVQPALTCRADLPSSACLHNWYLVAAMLAQ